MRFLIIFFFSLFFLNSFQVKGQYISLDSNSIKNVQISILTCNAGQDIYTIWGHTAIRVKNEQQKIDFVYNFGAFNFEEPNFLLLFLKGNLNYFLSVNYYTNFKEAYSAEGRVVVEQVLNLPDTNKIYVLEKLNNYVQNPYYHYNFTEDNCTNRAAKIFQSKQIIIPVIPTKNALKTYRQGIILSTQQQGLYFTALGINILLGYNTDKPLQNNNFSFLPALFMQQIEDVSQPKNLIQSTQLIVDNKNAISYTFNYAFYFCFFLLILFMVCWYFKKYKCINFYTNLILYLFGIIGFLIGIMWFLTAHTACHYNYNIIWANPIYLLFIFIRCKNNHYWKGLFVMFAGILGLIITIYLNGLFLLKEIILLQVLLIMIGIKKMKS